MKGQKEGEEHRIQINNSGIPAVYHYDPSTGKWPGEFIALKSDLIARNSVFYSKQIAVSSRQTKISFNTSNSSYMYLIGSVGATAKCCSAYFKKDTGEAIVANFGREDITVTYNTGGSVVVTLGSYFAGIAFFTENVNIVAS